MELAAAALAVKVDKGLRAELEIPIKDSTFWTDSITVLRYIINESRRYHTYVANRVSHIRSGSSPSQWSYINTKCNPADACTRPMPIDVLINNDAWKSGPDVLKQEKIEKQTLPEEVYETLDEDPEVKKEKVACCRKRGFTRKYL